MKNFIWFVLFICLASCSSEVDNEATIIYKKVLPELIREESYVFNLEFIPPPPPLKRKEGETREVSDLKQRVHSLENLVRIYKAENQKDKEIHILRKLLPLTPEKFKAAGIIEFRFDYDTTWVGKPLLDKQKPSKTLNFNVDGLKIDVYDIHLTDSIPEPFSVKGNENEKTRLFYLQLSEILFNKEKNKVIFYYAISTDQNAYGLAGYAYLVKENSTWKLKRTKE